MKQKLIFIVFAVLMNTSISGQNFISSGKQWNVRQTFGHGMTTEIFKIEGDSIVDSKSYKKIWVSYDSLTTMAFQGLLREESNVVYYIPPDLSEGILYDFNLEIGDTISVKNIFCGDEEIPITVINIDTVDFFGISRKRWQLDSYGGSEEYWVEGIGSLNGPLYTKYWYCMICPVWELLCYHNNDTLEYIMPYETDCYQNTDGVNENNIKNDFSIKPNPVRKGYPVYIETNSVPNSIRIYNSTGLLEKRLNQLSDKIIRIETNDFKPGLHFIRITTTGNITKTQKMMIE